MSENKITFPAKLASNNPQSFGIANATEISGHKSVDTLSGLYAISDPVLSTLKDGSDAIGQEWFVVSEDCKYRLDNWANRKSVAGWTKLPKQELVNTKQSVSEKDQPSGYAGLDSNGKIPIEKTYGTTATVVDVNTYKSLPVTGLSGVIYYVSNTGAQYKWSGSSYVDITDGADNAKKNETSIFDCSNGTSTKYYSSLSAAINIVPPVYRTSNRIISYLSVEYPQVELIVNKAATVDGSISIYLDGVLKSTISVTAGMTAIEIADKLSDSTYVDYAPWSWTDNGATNKFTLTYGNNNIAKKITTYSYAADIAEESGLISFNILKEGFAPTAVNYQYHGIDSTTWTNLTKWERVPSQSDLAEIRSDLKKGYLNLGIATTSTVPAVYGANDRVYYTIDCPASASTFTLANFGGLVIPSLTTPTKFNLKWTGLTWIFEITTIVDKNDIYNKIYESNSYPVTSGIAISWIDGKEVSVSGSKSTDYIAITNDMIGTKGMTLTERYWGNYGLAFYDENKIFIKGYIGYSLNPLYVTDDQIEIPINAAYLRTCSTAQIIYVTLWHYENKINKNKESIDALSVEATKLSTLIGDYTSEPLQLTTMPKTWLSPSLKIGDVISYEPYIYRGVFTIDVRDKQTATICISGTFGDSNKPLLAITNEDNVVIGLYHSIENGEELFSIDLNKYENPVMIHFIAYTNNATYIPKAYVSLQPISKQALQCKKYVDVAISSEGTTLSDAPFCEIVDSTAVKISGTGTKTIILSFPSIIAASNVAIGLLLPWKTQKVAAVNIGYNGGGVPINIALVNSNLYSGYSFYLQGDTYNRINIPAYKGIDNITLTITTVRSDSEWDLNISTKAIIEDKYPKTPICILYDGAIWDGDITDGNDIIDQWQMHDRLAIPYGICFDTAANSAVWNPNAADAIESGLAEKILRSADAIQYFKSSDSVLTTTISSLYNTVEAETHSISVLGSHLFDKKVIRCLKGAGTKIVRGNNNRDFGILSNRGRDGEISVLSGSSMGAVTKFPLNGMPVILWQHGIGTPPSPDQSMYYGNGANTLSMLKWLKEREAWGDVVILPPSQFVDYVKNKL